VILRARRPVGLGWRLVGRFPDPATGAVLLGWVHKASFTQVLSSLVIADLPKSGKPGPQWNVSIVGRPEGGAPQRPTAAQVALARCAFDILTAEEDNHMPGAAAHFWLPVDPSERVECECKSTEVQVVEADGYRWSNDADPTNCRGCELERAMRRIGKTQLCPIHARSAGDVAAPALPFHGETR